MNPLDHVVESGSIKNTLRAADPGDLQHLANLVHFEFYVHRHLDYRPPLDWLGTQPFLVLENRRKITATLACPPDPPSSAWIRLFAAASSLPLESTWSALWEQASEQIARNPAIRRAAAIPMSEWFEKLLARSGFVQASRIVMLAWERSPLPADSPPPGLHIRPITLDDLPMVAALDASAFAPVWQNSLDCLELAFRQSAVATLAEINGNPCAYQISTPTPAGGHLARLAVHPLLQGQRIGYALLRDLLAQFAGHGARSVTVNTQADNLSSLALYQGMGFRLTGESYPFYEMEIKPKADSLRN